MNSMRKRKLTKNYTNFLTEGAGINEVKTMKKLKMNYLYTNLWLPAQFILVFKRPRYTDLPHF